MTKSTITRTWITGLVVLAGGLVVVGLSIGLMVAYGGTFIAAPSGNGYDFVPRFDSFFWTTVGFMVLGFTAVVAGGIVLLEGRAKAGTSEAIRGRFRGFRGRQPQTRLTRAGRR